MILKSLSRKSDSTGQLVNYVMRYVFKEQDITLKETRLKNSESRPSSFIIRHNLRSRTSLKGFIKEFQENESYRLVKRKDSVKLFHNIISFSNRDKEAITDEMLKDMSKKFFELRGTNNIFLGTKHEEGIDHIHLHLIVSGTQLNGRSSRISKQKFHSIKLALDAYQKEKYPQLKYSLPEHGKAKKITKEAILAHVKANRQSNKQMLLETMDRIYAGSKSKEEFLEKLKNSGHEVYMRNGKVQGVTYKEKKFRFSRLGFDEERFSGLNQVQNIRDNALSDLRQIRENKVSKTKSRNPFENEIDKINHDRNIEQLEDLNSIRARKAAKELDRNDEQERSFDFKDVAGNEQNENEIESGISNVFGGLRKFANPIKLETK